jgi:hypothetical protein
VRDAGAAFRAFLRSSKTESHGNSKRFARTARRLASLILFSPAFRACCGRVAELEQLGAALTSTLQARRQRAPITRSDPAIDLNASYVTCVCGGGAALAQSTRVQTPSGSLSNLRLEIPLNVVALLAA